MCDKKSYKQLFSERVWTCYSVNSSLWERAVGVIRRCEASQTKSLSYRKSKPWGATTTASI